MGAGSPEKGERIGLRLAKMDGFLGVLTEGAKYALLQFEGSVATCEMSKPLCRDVPWMLIKAYFS
jgi:hypothetical protein